MPSLGYNFVVLKIQKALFENTNKLVFLEDTAFCHGVDSILFVPLGKGLET